MHHGSELPPPGEGSPSRAAASRPAPGDSEDLLRAILHTAVEGIITIDDRGLIESMNPAAEKIFGWTAAEVIGQNVKMLMPAPYREEHDGYLRHYQETGEARIIGIGREVMGQRKDGSTFAMDLAVSEVRMADRRVYTGFVRDISDRKRAEAQLESLAQTLAEKNKELETIVYVASHDLRSPLVNIQGFSKELALSCAQLRTDMLADEARPTSEQSRTLLTRDIPEALEFIQAGVAKIDALLAGFLRYSRLGRAAMKVGRIDMNLLLQNNLKAMEFQIKQAGATLDVQRVPDCLGDPILTTQVFANLLDNALKYRAPDRAGMITVSGRIEGGLSIYVVRDNGIGIPIVHQPKIFEIFHRLNPAHGDGEGLGLTIAQRILEREGGKIWVESEPGKGSAFFVSLPAAPKSQ